MSRKSNMSPSRQGRLRLSVGTGRSLPGRGRRWVVVLAASLAAGVGACGGDAPDAGVPGEPFTVRFGTSSGPVEVEFVPEWSPLAVERVRELARMGYWEGARIYRVNERYAQFGYSGHPALDSTWIQQGIPDEPPRASNARGTVSFARGGPGSRSAILFINRTDNAMLDSMDWRGVLGFPPVGRVVSGMETVDRLHDAYGDDPMQWEDSIAALGNAFLDRAYPGLDSIVTVEIVDGGA